jgi:hypothetical protein
MSTIKKGSVSFRSFFHASSERGTKQEEENFLACWEVDFGGVAWKRNDIHEEQSFEDNTFYIFLVVF